MYPFTRLRALCLSVLIPVCLSGCTRDSGDLTGYWKIDEQGCLTLCAFTLKPDKASGKLMLFFDEDSTLARKSNGELRKVSETHYTLLFSGGGKIGFTLENGKLIVEEGSVFEKTVGNAALP